MKSITNIFLGLMLSGMIHSQTSIDYNIFLFGRDSLPNNGEVVSDTFFFFDRTKAAFRGGSLFTSDNWSPDSLGFSSIAYGYLVKAPGDYGATAFGVSTTASGGWGALATGYRTIASGLFGATAMGSSTIASGFIGATALGSNTNAFGSYGATALGCNTYAYGNFGATALGHLTTATGLYGATALGLNTSASGNDGATALGYYSRASGNDGATALGHSTEASGYSGATALGRATKASGFHGATALGVNTRATGSDGATALGRETNASGNNGASSLGYGTNATGNSCTVVGVYNDTLVHAGTTITTTSPLFIVGNGESGLGNESNAMVVRKDGNVGIGRNNPMATLDVKGDIRIGTTGMTGCIKDASGGTIIGTCSSDQRFKKDIIPLERQLNLISRLQPVHYKWRSDEFPEQLFSDKTEFGLIAQDVEEIFPAMVVTDENGYKKVAYHHIPLLNLQAVRELKEENDQLKLDNEIMKKEMATLKSMIQSILVSINSGSPGIQKTDK